MVCSFFFLYYNIWKGKLKMMGGDGLQVNRKEILRYLGYGTSEADETIKKLMEECILEIEKYASPKIVTRVVPIHFLSENEKDFIDFGVFRTKSKSLATNLKDCEQVIFFAATLGLGIDQLIRKYSKFEMSRVVVIQAAATALLEGYCNEQCKNLSKEWEEKGFYSRPRFSPGYGDFSLEYQKPLLESLEVEKRIGIYLTESLLMTPSKSVSAVIGLSRKPHRCEVMGCEVCEKKDCLYRRN